MRKSSIIYILLLCWALLAPSFVLAQAPVDPEQLARDQIQNGSICAQAPGKFTERIVNCIKDAVGNAAYQYLTNVYTYFKNTVYTAIMLGVTLYGVLLAVGAIRRPPQQTFMLALKIGFVAFAIGHFAEFYYDIMAAMEDLANKVTAYTSISTTLGCTANAQLWARIDCAIDTIVGFSGQTSLIGGLIGFMITSFKAETAGKLIFIMGLGFILTMLMAVARAVYVFVMAYVALAFMVAISPIFISLMIFRAGWDYFLKWCKLFMSFFLQPIILFAYLSMMLAAFDITVVEGEHSLYRTLAPDIGNGETIGQYMLRKGAYSDQDMGTIYADFDPSEAGKSEGVAEMGIFGKMAESLHKKFSESWTGSKLELSKVTKAFKIAIPITKVDYEMLARSNGMDPQEYVLNIMISLLFCMMFAYIMSSMLKYVPILGNELTGGFLESPNLARGGLPFESRVSGMLRSGASSLMIKK